MMGRPGRHGDGGAGWFFVAMAFSLMGIMIGLVAVTRVLGPVSIPIWIFTMIGMVAISRGPIGQAFAARIHPQALGDGGAGDGGEGVPAELYAELDELRARLTELEDRQDFSERMLLARRDEAKDAL